MVTVEEVLAAKSWSALGLDKTKDNLRFLQFQFHPDRNADQNAHEAFVKVNALFEGPDYFNRIATGVGMADHKIKWTPNAGFEDRVAPAANAQVHLSRLDPKFSMFFTKSVVEDGSLVTSYGEGWWFLDDFEVLDSRSVVWIAKRLAAAIVQSADSGLVHGNITPKTVVIKPSEHGLMLDGWWHVVSVNEKLVLKPDATTPARYFGGAVADGKLSVAQAASMLTNIGKPDKLLLERLKEAGAGDTDPITFFKDIDQTAKTLYGNPSWHELDIPSTKMI